MCPEVNHCHKDLSELTLSDGLFSFDRTDILARMPRGGREGTMAQDFVYILVGEWGLEQMSKQTEDNGNQFSNR